MYLIGYREQVLNFCEINNAVVLGNIQFYSKDVFIRVIDTIRFKYLSGHIFNCLKKVYGIFNLILKMFFMR